MNLCIDIGNSRIKLGIYDQDVLVYESKHITLLVSELKEIRKKYPFDQVAFSSVRKKEPRFNGYLKRNFPFLTLTPELKLPFVNQYDTPKTLGKDRIAVVAAAVGLFPKQNCLVIDIGTCMTLDFVDQKGNFMGGNISPGIRLRLQAMHEFTKALPLVTQKPVKKLMATTTDEAINNGAIQGIVFEIEGYIQKIEATHGLINVILTGGDAELFAELIEYQIFVDSNLVLKGLNEILKLNFS